MSWASSSGTIQVSQGHINAGPAIVRAVLAHEFSHLIAFRYGSQAFTGAAPQGWPSYSSRQIGRAHVCTPVTNAHLVCRLLLEKKKSPKSHQDVPTTT